MRHPDPRTIARAFGVLERLPHEALADLTERLVDRLDAAEPDCDLEPETDACSAEDVPIAGHHGPGDADDAEESGDLEPDADGGADADRDLTAPDEPLHGRLRGERDGFVVVHRRPREFVLVTSKGGRPVRVQTVIAERRG